MVSGSRRVQVKADFAVQYIALHQPARSGQRFQCLFQSHRAESVLRKRQRFASQKLCGMVIGAQAVAALFQQPVKASPTVSFRFSGGLMLTIWCSGLR